MPNHIRVLLLLPLLLATGLAAQDKAFTRADTLRGSNTPERAWWDATFYDLHVRVNPADSTVRGWNAIGYHITGKPREMQVDLQVPLEVDSIVQGGRQVRYRRDGNVLLLTVAKGKVGTSGSVTVHYHGRPRAAKNPPWDGGLIWSRDPDGAPWISTACQGLGASVWWPTKDIQSDEPDSQRIALTVPDSLQAVANGRLRAVQAADAGWTTYEWFVTEPINNYDVAAYIGRYASYTGTFAGERGNLTLTFWPLASHLARARDQWRQAEPMLRCFESWFGPYPWYRDGYQLVEAPHLGMEHQSAVAYGNAFGNGYKGKDLSATGWGLTFDFIVVHESAHEWFGNSITAEDVADNWLHESFANYSESLFVECQYGKAAGETYVRGTRALIKNDAPIVGTFGVNTEGSGDKYYKGGNTLNTLRQVIGNDSTWRAILRGLGERFGHQIASGRAVEQFFSQKAGMDLQPVFDQYLTTTRVPVFEYTSDGGTLKYRWGNVVPKFAMPVRVVAETGDTLALTPTAEWQTAALPAGPPGGVRVDENYYVETKRLDPAELERLQGLIAESGTDGWLLFDFRGRNPIASAVLGSEIVGSRRVFVLIPRAGSPVALVHAVDAELWRGWPSQWTKRVWVRRETLAEELGALVRGKRLAVDISPNGAIPYLDGVPAGVADWIGSLGATLVPSADLVTRYCSIWTAEDVASHRRAAAAIAAIAREALTRAGAAAAGEHPIREHEVAVWIRERFDRAGLLTEGSPSVSWGPNAARTHYEPTAEESRPIVRGALLLLDLWAREPGGIYADQTWMAAIGPPTERDAELWGVVRRARDAALDLLAERVRSGTPVRGAEADAAAKRVIADAGHLEHTVSRTGHSIDRYGIHGFGPPIDDTETYDDRLLLPGVGFSVEPGVYLPGVAGVRSEVNVVVGDRDILVTPDDYQTALLAV